MSFSNFMRTNAPRKLYDVWCASNHGLQLTIEERCTINWYRCKFEKVFAK